MGQFVSGIRGTNEMAADGIKWEDISIRGMPLNYRWVDSPILWISDYTVELSKIKIM